LFKFCGGIRLRGHFSYSNISKNSKQNFKKIEDVSGVHMGENYEKNRDQRSCATVPLNEQAEGPRINGF
jgi:hypothetical protein